MDECLVRMGGMKGERHEYILIVAKKDSLSLSLSLSLCNKNPKQNSEEIVETL